MKRHDSFEGLWSTSSDNESEADSFDEIPSPPNVPESPVVQTGGINIRKIPCGHCEKNFGSLFALKRHVRIVHEGKRYTCELCHENFTRKLKLDTHNCTPNLACQKCGKDYNSKPELLAHIKACQRTCDDCGKLYDGMKKDHSKQCEAL